MRNYSIIDQIQKELNQYKTDLVLSTFILKGDYDMNIHKLDNQNLPSKNENKLAYYENSSFENLISNNNERADAESAQKSNHDYSALKKKILETVSEEINTHLALILDYAEQLKNSPLPSEANKLVQRIIDKSNFIINSLKAQSSFYNGDLELNTQIIYATTVFDDILNLLSGYAEFRGIKLTRKFEADASILADKNMLYHACLEIIKFLCDCMPNKGEISTLLTRTKDMIILEFQAKGIIISSDFFKDVFQEAASQGKLTLAYAQSIIKAHKGLIKTGRTIDSTPEIKLELPIIR